MSGWTHTYEFAMPAPADRTFAAITDASALAQWFADFAEAEPRDGGAFRFWGKGAYSVPTRAAATQIQTAFEPGRLIGFTWPIHGQTSQVTLTVTSKEDDGTSKLAVTHTFAALPEVPRFKHLIDDLWRMHFGNLYAFLKNGAAAIRPDFADPDPVVRASIFVAAPPAKVFRALIDPAMLDKWMGMGGSASVEPVKGGRYDLGWSYEIEGRAVAGGPTRILDLVENRLLVTDWTDWRGDPAVPQQTITWELVPDGDGTRVTLTHSGFLRTADISDYALGWGGFLDQLRAIAEAP